jgi:hypothetical protein
MAVESETVALVGLSKWTVMSYPSEENSLRDDRPASSCTNGHLKQVGS